jgi:small subunit ribosomal protein S8e
MVILQEKARRSSTGARYRANRKKRMSSIGRVPSLTKLGKTTIKPIRMRNGSHKQRMLTADIANVLDPKSKKFEKLKIITIVGNPANRHFVRRNIMTKGAIIKTDKGNARITSRPGADGVVNAVLVQ